MDDPSDVPPLPEPRQPPLVSPPLHSDGQGCGRPALAGCALLLALLVGSSVLVLVKSTELFEWGFGVSKGQILGALSDEVTAAERGRLERAFEGVSRAVASGGLEPSQLPILQAELGDALRLARERSLDPEDVQRLSEALETIVRAGRTPRVGPRVEEEGGS